MYYPPPVSRRFHLLANSPWLILPEIRVIIQVPFCEYKKYLPQFRNVHQIFCLSVPKSLSLFNAQLACRHSSFYYRQHCNRLLERGNQRVGSCTRIQNVYVEIQCIDFNLQISSLTILLLKIVQYDLT